MQQLAIKRHDLMKSGCRQKQQDHPRSKVQAVICEAVLDFMAGLNQQQREGRILPSAKSQLKEEGDLSDREIFQPVLSGVW